MNAIHEAATTIAESSSPTLMSLRTLIQAAHLNQDLRPLGAELIARVQAHPDDAYALMDLSLVLQMLGDHALAMNVQAEALQMQRLYHVVAPSRGEVRLRVLAIMVSGDLMSNTPLECLLHDSDIALDALYVTPDKPLPDAVPEHDVLFIAVGESDRTQPVLEHLRELAAIWPRPVLNMPERVQRLSRDAAASVLAGLPGVCMPITSRVDRQALDDVAHARKELSLVLPDGCFPIIVRPLGSHAGKGLEKIDDPAALIDYLAQSTASAFYVSRFIDYRSADGQFRKYRIALIEGCPYVCHVGISDHWMIHYLNAGMTESQAKRDEEAAIMRDFDHGFALRHRSALALIQERMDLDYLGLDCAETPAGDLLVFEVDTAMVVHDIDPVDLFPYKQPQMRKVFDAFRTLLVHASEREHAE
ncbi:RimK family alpha-L-glutamate ligase [Variovorax sp. Sphag1AA]|uniref:ATP-grasp domain-containing protein n=1 Tax=Variovorax sp. Sphag1AA TaxID=2587027 RepID=UPI001607A391|nr:RimK family alpha-L-glutamate ligase [Variovorax sp. Sphag1AA]MBB3178065.1 glutathione synthase/RimK-type ligase-like ATP-grasp enzyme [Variovorax sp. Sphag1AA]